MIRSASYVITVICGVAVVSAYFYRVFEAVYAVDTFVYVAAFAAILFGAWRNQINLVGVLWVSILFSSVGYVVAVSTGLYKELLWQLVIPFRWLWLALAFGTLVFMVTWGACSDLAISEQKKRKFADFVLPIAIGALGLTVVVNLVERLPSQHEIGILNEIMYELVTLERISFGVVLLTFLPALLLSHLLKTVFERSSRAKDGMAN